MSTNYYVAKNCPKCAHPVGEGVHIGKRSGGWRFLFHHPRSYETDDVELNSWAAWKAYLARDGVQIINEYSEVIPLHEFVGLVEATRNDRNDRDHGEVLDESGWPRRMGWFT